MWCRKTRSSPTFFLIKYPSSSFLQSERCIFSLCSLVIDFACLAPPLRTALQVWIISRFVCERWKTSGQVKKNHDRQNLLMNSFHSPSLQSSGQQGTLNKQKNKKEEENQSEAHISMSNNYSPLFFKTPRLDVINYPLRFINWESQTSPIQTQFKFFECCPPRLIIARFWLILKACWLVSVSADEGGYAVCKWHLSE